MKNLTTITVLSILLISLNSCHKNDAKSAVITIEEPIIGDTIAFGDSLHLEGTIAGDGKMRGYSLTFTNVSTGGILNELQSDKRAGSYSFHEHWQNNVSDTALVHLMVEVTLDHDGNKAMKDVYVVCLPN